VDSAGGKTDVDLQHLLPQPSVAGIVLDAAMGAHEQRVADQIA